MKAKHLVRAHCSVQSLVLALHLYGDSTVAQLAAATGRRKENVRRRLADMEQYGEVGHDENDVWSLCDPVRQLLRGAE